MIEEKWFHEHWEMLTTGVLVGGVLIRYYWRAYFDKYATKDALASCYNKVSEELKEMRKENSKQHMDIVQTILEHIKK